MTDDPDGDADTASPEGSPWTELLADADAIAAEYRTEGWTVDVVEPRDVAPWTDTGGDAQPQGGFVALVDGDVIAALEPIVEERAFDTAEVYQRSVEGVTLALLVELDGPTERAIVLPLYYRSGEADDALASAARAGELQVRVRAEGDDDWLTFVHDDPALFDGDGRA